MERMEKIQRMRSVQPQAHLLPGGPGRTRPSTMHLSGRTGKFCGCAEMAATPHVALREGDGQPLSAKPGMVGYSPHVFSCARCVGTLSHVPPANHTS